MEVDEGLGGHVGQQYRPRRRARKIPNEKNAGIRDGIRAFF
jgi:hypothetical protein